MQMSGGHLLAAGLDGGNTLIFAKGENVIKSRLAGTSIVLNTYKESIEIVRFRCVFFCRKQHLSTENGCIPEDRLPTFLFE